MRSGVEFIEQVTIIVTVLWTEGLIISSFVTEKTGSNFLPRLRKLRYSHEQKGHKVKKRCPIFYSLGPFVSCAEGRFTEIFLLHQTCHVLPAVAS